MTTKRIRRWRPGSSRPIPMSAQALADAMLLWRARADLGQDGPFPFAETRARHEWSDADRTRANTSSSAIIAETPERVQAELAGLATAHGHEEIMVDTLTSDPVDRLASYRLLAEPFTP